MSLPSPGLNGGPDHTRIFRHPSPFAATPAYSQHTGHAKLSRFSGLGTPSALHSGQPPQLVTRSRSRVFCLFCSLPCAQHLEWNLAHTWHSILIRHHCFGSNANFSE